MLAAHCTGHKTLDQQALREPDQIDVGITIKTPAADMGPQSILYCVTKLVRPTGSVCASLLEVRVSAMRKSFQVNRNVMTALAPRPGAIIGDTICTRVRSVLAPSTCADFSNFFRQILDEAHQQPNRDWQLCRRVRQYQGPHSVEHVELRKHYE